MFENRCVSPETRRARSLNVLLKIVVFLDIVYYEYIYVYIKEKTDKINIYLKLLNVFVHAYIFRIK